MRERTAVRNPPLQAAVTALVVAPRADRDDQQDRIAPDAGGCGIGLRQQFELNRFEDVRHARGELQAGDPQRPEALGSERDIGERREDQEVHRQLSGLDAAVAPGQRREDED